MYSSILQSQNMSTLLLRKLIFEVRVLWWVGCENGDLQALQRIWTRFLVEAADPSPTEKTISRSIDSYKHRKYDQKYSSSRERSCHDV